MPTAADHEKSAFNKLLLIGASGAGKTGALTSLVKAGYKLRILDFDNGLDALVHLLREQKLPLDAVQYMSFRDRMTMTTQGPKLKGSPRAYSNALAALETWEDGSDPSEWGPDTVCVVDSLTNVGRAAFQWARHMNPTSRDPRQWYKAAQDLIEDMIANLTDEGFNAHVIVITHIDIGETAGGGIKHFPSSIGKAIGTKLPRFFNTMLLSETKRTGTKISRTIHTMPTATLDLKNPAPAKIQASYPLETALADIFQALKA